MNLIDTGIEKGLFRFDEDNYIATVEKWEKEKSDAIKKLETDAKKANPTFDKKKITEIIQSEKSVAQTTFTDKVNLLKEELAEKYFLTKQTALDDYPIFMAIAEDIGYDTTGRSTNNNELIEIGKELSKFIAHISKTEK
ncbi:MAG: hypothetical protein JSS98_18620 [Bacteroidetes bacterium]|nr:hypothetical protein [Bacteroidota bacterium]